MLQIKCDSCGNELDKPGALLFSPPFKDNTCVKFHICSKCYMDLMVKLDNGEFSENSE